jgi:hypothetical protein
VTDSRVHPFLARNEFRVCRTINSVQEQTRLQVPQTFLDNVIALIKEWLPLVPAELILNIDECGSSDWEERKNKQVLLPSKVSNTSLHYPADRPICHQ